MSLRWHWHKLPVLSCQIKKNTRKWCPMKNKLDPILCPFTCRDRFECHWILNFWLSPSPKWMKLGWWLSVCNFPLELFSFLNFILLHLFIHSSNCPSVPQSSFKTQMHCHLPQQIFLRHCQEKHILQIYHDWMGLLLSWWRQRENYAKGQT